MTHPPTLPEAIELIRKMVADLKKLPFDYNEPERLDNVSAAENLIWRYNNLQNGGKQF